MHLKLWSNFTQLVEQKKLPQAVLLSGAKAEEGVQFAKAAAEYLLAKDAAQLALCRSPSGHPDLLWLAPIDEKSAIKIDQVRSVTHVLEQTAFTETGWRVVIIEEAQRMNLQAQQALLKTLEAPRERSTIWLLTTSPKWLLPTIRSRCQRFVMSQGAAHLAELSGFSKELVERLLALENPLALSRDCQGQSLLETTDALVSFLAELLRCKLLGVVHPPYVAFHQKLAQLAARVEIPEVLACIDYCFFKKSALALQINLNPALYLDDLLISFGDVGNGSR